MSIEALATHDAVREGAGQVGAALGRERLAAMQETGNAPWDAPKTPGDQLVYPEGLPDPLPAAAHSPVTAA
jgi:hypothetical protein